MATVILIQVLRDGSQRIESHSSQYIYWPLFPNSNRSCGSHGIESRSSENESVNEEFVFHLLECSSRSLRGRLNGRNRDVWQDYVRANARMRTHSSLSLLVTETQRP